MERVIRLQSLLAITIRYQSVIIRRHCCRLWEVRPLGLRDILYTSIQKPISAIILWSTVIALGNVAYHSCSVYPCELYVILTGDPSSRSDLSSDQHPTV